MKHLALLLGLASLAVQLSFAQPVEPLERPVLAQGDRWLYRVVDLWSERETVSREDSVVEVVLDGVRLRRSNLPSKDTQSAVGSSFEFFTTVWPVPTTPTISGRFTGLDFPLTTGKRWVMEFSTGSATNVRPERRAATVEGWETVKVPAGEFKAIRVVHEGTRMLNARDGVFGSPTYEVLWYAPEVKSYVRREYRNKDAKGALANQFREELVEFTVK